MRIPYHAQWASPGLVGAILRGGLDARLDPRWADSGASDPDDYEFWSRRACGMACLRSVLEATGRTSPPTVALAHEVLAAGGYRIRTDGGVEGLIYAPFVAYLGVRWRLAAAVEAPLPVDDLLERLAAGRWVMASVSPLIRWPASPPPTTGGHLVLVHGAHGDDLVLHNPSGDRPDNQEHVRIDTEVFTRFYAGRGISVTPDPAPTER